MNAARTQLREPRIAPTYLQLHPLRGRRNEFWTMQLTEEILTLIGPDNKSVLEFHRDEAARYMRFSYDLFRAHVVSLVIVEGLKTYSFRCNRVHISKLLSWVPQEPPPLRARSIRRAALIAALFGLLFLVLPQHALRFWGAPLLAAGALGYFIPRWWVFALDGTLLVAAGLHALALHSLTVHPEMEQPEYLFPPLVVGSLVILSGIQQFSMLGPNQRLRAARAVRDLRAAFLPERSALVRRVGTLNIEAASVFAIYLLTVLLRILLSRGSPTFHDCLPDLVSFAMLIPLCLASGLFFLHQRNPLYVEAKVSGQFLIAVSALVVWGAVLTFVESGPMAVIGGVFSPRLFSSTRPYLWATVIAAVVGFNRWFTHHFDRELEEQRG